MFLSFNFGFVVDFIAMNYIKNLYLNELTSRINKLKLTKKVIY